ncbi:MAG: substrate-binding domain-containing protein [Lachnospiraceae bacterium]|nr:substrate-binding domain-containing protein [Lachnospiraceae bacterium]
MKETGSKLPKKERLLTGILLSVTVIMLIATMVSLFFFRRQMRMVNKPNEESERIYDKHYALIVDDPDDPLWTSVYSQMQAVGDTKNAYVELFGENLSTTYGKADLVRIAIESKVDGIILEAEESDEMTALIYKAGQQGIPVVTVLHDCVGSGRVSFVGINNYSFGNEYGTLILKAATEIRAMKESQEDAADEVHVLILLDGQSQDTSQSIVYAAVQENIEAAGDAAKKLVIETERINATSVFRTEERIRDIVQNKESLPDIIVCLNEQNTASIYQTLVDQNKVGQIYVIGYFDSETILRGIERKGIYATVTIGAQQLGTYCVEALDEYVNTGYVSDYFSVDFTCINAENVSEYLKKGEENETD